MISRLNTCVGKKNYSWFLATAGSVACMTSLLLAICVALVVDCFAREDDLRSRRKPLPSPLSATHLSYHPCAVSHQSTVQLQFDAVKGLLLGSSALLGGLVAMVYQLVGFHCMLLFYGITTYDFIINEQKKERERAANKIKAKQTSPGGAPPATALGNNITTYEQFKAASERVQGPEKSPSADSDPEAAEFKVVTANHRKVSAEL